MVNLTIDDKQVAVEKDATIYDAAKSAGIKIPILCHDKKLHPFGGCRMCLVEVEQMKGRLIPSCTTPATEGMIVRTSNEEIIKARKLVLELLLLKHPVDCPVCDAAGDCDLQNLTYEYGVSKNPLQDEKFRWEIDYINPLIERDMNRCVHCGKCARICDEIVSFGAYTFINRGIDAKMGTAFDGPLDCEFCGSCVSVCPVGALLSRPFKFKARWWSMQKVKTVCSYCGTGCQLTLGVKDNKVLTTIYDENQGFHNGQLCTRGRWGYQFVNSEKRLTTPLIRKGNSLVEATWDEALALVSSKLREANGAVAGLVTPRLTNEELFLFKKFFTDGLGSESIDHSAGYAHEALTTAALKGLGQSASPSVIADIQKTDFLLVVKTDAYETHPVIGFEINLGVKRQGVNLRLVSDKSGKLSRLPGAKTTVHTPGSEATLFNTLANIIITEKLAAECAATLPGYDALVKAVSGYTVEKGAAATGIPAEELMALAKEYAAAEKALILLPLGMAYPGHNAALAQTLLNLALLTGRIGKEGSGVLFMGEKNNSQGAVDMGIIPGAKGKDAAGIIDGCASGEIKALYIAGENPVVSYPNRKKVELALEKVGFLVVQDLFLTETAAKAHVVLPACSFAEKEGTFTSVGRNVQKVTKAIKPVGSSKSDFEIFNKLYAEFTGKPLFASAQAVFSEIVASVPGYAGLTWAKLGTNGVIRPVTISPVYVPVEASVTVSEPGKFALLTGSALNHSGTLSQYGEGPMMVCPEGYVEFGRADVKKLGLADEDTVTVTSATGSVTLKVKLGNRLSEGVLFAPYHFGANSINTITTGAPVTWVSVAKAK
jgi:NADH-quinone oxidoreductase subunit G